MPVLKGPSVLLRPLEHRDYSRVFPWYNAPDIVAPFDRFSVDSFDGFVHEVESAASDPTSLAPRFVVERRKEGDVVGVLGYYRAHPVLEFLDIWYVLGDPEARGHGLGREAVGLLVDHLFGSTEVERIGATCDVENVASYRLLERLGFRWEGTMRSALFHHGGWHDVRFYGVTRAEWAARAPPI